MDINIHANEISYHTFKYIQSSYHKYINEIDTNYILNT